MHVSLNIESLSFDDVLFALIAAHKFKRQPGETQHRLTADSS